MVRPSYMLLFLCVAVFAVDKKFMKWPFRNVGATYLRDATYTVQTVLYSDSQCTVYTAKYWHERRHCSWCYAELYCIAPWPFTVRVFLFGYSSFLSHGQFYGCLCFKGRLSFAGCLPFLAHLKSCLVYVHKGLWIFSRSLLNKHKICEEVVWVEQRQIYVS